jgi:hypothetical protein
MPQAQPPRPPVGGDAVTLASGLGSGLASGVGDPASIAPPASGATLPHRWVATSQTPLGQSASPAQPTHVLVEGSQTPDGGVQSLRDVHSTQRPAYAPVVEQTGVSATQSNGTQGRHVLAVESQIGAFRSA